MTGPFISLDGIDGTGKSTQCRMLAAWLRTQGRSVVEAVDPGGTPLGQAVRTLVLGHRNEMSVRAEMLLFMASRAELVTEVIQPALVAGETVVCDRYLLANVAYQGHGGGLDPAEVWEIGSRCTGVLPDLTLILDLPLSEAMRRRGREPDRMERRDLAFHQRVREGFLAEYRSQRLPIHLIDASGDLQSVHERIQKAVAEVL